MRLCEVDGELDVGLDWPPLPFAVFAIGAGFVLDPHPHDAPRMLLLCLVPSLDYLIFTCHDASYYTYTPAPPSRTSRCLAPTRRPHMLGGGASITMH